MKLFPLVLLAVLSSGLFRPMIAAASSMTFAFPESYAPMIWKEDGRMKGAIIDVLNITLRNRLNVQTEYHGFPWSRAQVNVKKGISDAFVTIPTPERLSYASCSKEPVFTTPIRIYTYNNHPKRADILSIKSKEDLLKFVLVDYRGNGWIRSQLPEAKVIWTDSIEQSYKLLANKRADLIIRDTIHFDYFARENKFLDQIEKTSVIVDQIKIHLCINRGSDHVQILPKFDEVIKDLHHQGIIESITDQYTKPSIPMN